VGIGEREEGWDEQKERGGGEEVCDGACCSHGVSLSSGYGGVDWRLSSTREERLRSIGKRKSF
jgi:hypothetical protein